MYMKGEVRPWSSFIDKPPARSSEQHRHYAMPGPRSCRVYGSIPRAAICTRLCSAPPFEPGLGIAKMTHSEYQSRGAD